MRRIFMLLLLTFVFYSLRVYSTNISFLNTIPENGSEITTFDIKLKFDISEAITESGNENIRIGYTGNTRTTNTKIYDGTAEEGTLLTTVLTKSVKGVEYSNDYIDLEIPSSFVPEPGHTYTVVFANQVAMFDANGASVANSVISYNKEPITFTFHGASASSEDLLFQKASVNNNDNIESLSSVIFEYNEEIEILSNKSIEICNGEELIASSKSTEIDTFNSKALKAIFDDVTLCLGNQYTIKLPEGLVSLKKNSTVINKPVEIKVNGASTVRLSTKYISIENNSVVLPDHVRIEFNLEDGQTLTAPEGVIHKRDIDFYKGEISDDNFIQTLRGTASGDGITWDLSTFRFEPEAKYMLRMKADGITVWANGKSQPAYGNEEVVISFTTPTVEEAGYAPMEFSNPILKTELHSDNIEYEQDMALPYIHTLYFGLKDNYYFVGNAKYDLTTHPDALECSIYEITAEGDKLLQNLKLDETLASDKNGYYNLAKKELQTYLYERKKYKLVIPSGYFTVYPVIRNVGQTMDLSRCNYIKSPELVYTFTGTTPSKAVMLDCNVQNDAEVSTLYNIIWTFDGSYRLSDDITTVKREYTTVSGIGTLSIEYPVTVSTYMGKTMVMVDFVSKISGTPLKISKGTTSTFTVPKGLIVNIMNDEIVNDEIVLKVIGGEEASPAVDVNLTINDLHSASHKAVKGEKYSFTVAPNNDWKVESVMHGDKVLTAKNGVYTTEPLNEDANIKANLAYAGQLATEITTDVWEITDKNISIYRDNDHIVVDGVTPANTINVYSVSGLLITSIRATDGNDRVNITVPSGQMYIVSVDGVAAKIQM